jgi:hypothetical protein
MNSFSNQQLLLSIAIMMASNKHLIEQMRPMDLMGALMNQRRSHGSALAAPHGTASTLQGLASLKSRVIVPSSSKRQQSGSIPT